MTTLREILRKVAADGAGLKFSVPEAEQQIESLIRERVIEELEQSLPTLHKRLLENEIEGREVDMVCSDFMEERIAELKGEQDVPRN